VLEPLARIVPFRFRHSPQSRARVLWILLLVIGIAAASAALWHRAHPSLVVEPAQELAAVHTFGYDVVREFPHDPDAVTQGLIYRNGFLYESTGLTGQSSLRQVQLDSGAVIQRRRIAAPHCAEGLTEWHGRLVQLTPVRTELRGAAAFAKIRELSFVVAALGRRLDMNFGATYDLTSFEPRSSFTYRGEGWGITHDGRRLIMSDGTSQLRFLDPDTFSDRGSVQVVDGGRAIDYVNELEFVNGELYANIWLQDRIAIIGLDSGRVRGWIDLGGLASRMLPPPDTASGAVLNGIAYDAQGGRLFVTGKRWPRVFEIRLRPGHRPSGSR
jgi:glutamine cyclotransferase